MLLIGVTRKLSLLASCALRIYNRVMLLSAFFLFSLQLNWYVVPLRTTHIFADELTFFVSYSLLIVYVVWAYETLLSYSFLKCFPSFAP